jgi:hypothetical protein
VIGLPGLQKSGGSLVLGSLVVSILANRRLGTLSLGMVHKVQLPCGWLSDRLPIGCVAAFRSD